MDLKCAHLTLSLLILMNIAVCSCESIETKFFGETVELKCESNGDEELFQLWDTPFGVVAPGFNGSRIKYKYDVLSGDLKISNLQRAEQGQYTCWSRNPKTGRYSSSSLFLIVKERWNVLYENDYLTNVWRSGILVVLCIVIFFGWIQLKMHYSYIPLTAMDDEEIGELRFSDDIELSTDLPRSRSPHQDSFRS